MDGDRLGTGLPLLVELGPVASEVVEQPPGLVLLRVQAGQRVQPAAVMTRLDDAGIEAQPVAVVARDELELLDVEAELVQPVQPLVDPVARVVGEELVAHQLVPERLVARDGLPPSSGRQPRGRAPPRRRRLAGEVLLGDQEVVAALPSVGLGCSSPVSASTR